ncbi:DNA-binding protein WhiA [Christensenellaceae bacterium NSJ-44]|uniref:Probable cell division protein WhiA n=1 Tax=Luoshenia tenuis TaxID=2763654 RepID=A0A926CWV1_9FIRM|nr:DNA-binding protein WhiA [Luoshenia tenuis]MBC8528160.1 DNA-binding protein WhiA [Luoshenia tenuis]
MSFSSETREELCRLPFGEDCCVRAELAALIHVAGTITLSGGEMALRIATESASCARRVFRLFKRVYGIAPQVASGQKRRLKKNHAYYLTVTKGAREALEDAGLISKKGGGLVFNRGIDRELVRRDCCRRAYIRGAFLGAGSLTTPEKGYHLEFVLSTEEFARDLMALINSFSLGAKNLARKGSYVVYLKEGESISSLLVVIGAMNSVLALENVRVLKEMRNQVNRSVNCETANLAKTAFAAARQIEAITALESSGKLAKLSAPLREMAAVRLDNPEASLIELGEMLDPPVGKSAVNHRLRRLEEMAQQLRQEKGDY